MPALRPRGDGADPGQLLDAARTAGVRRFILIGTEAALFDGPDLRDIDETQPYPRRQRFLYSETKAEAERRVLAASDDRMTTLSVRPRLVWGPRDASVLPATAAMIAAGRFRWIDGGRPETSTTHIANLVHGVERALTHGPGGQARPTGPRPGPCSARSRAPSRRCGACSGSDEIRRCRRSRWR